MRQSRAIPYDPPSRMTEPPREARQVWLRSASLGRALEELGQLGSEVWLETRTEKREVMS